MVFGSRTVKQSRAGGVEREFSFFRDTDGKPWLDVKSNDGDQVSYSFNEKEFQAFVEAARET